MMANTVEIITTKLYDEVYIFVASATRALKNLLRQYRRSPWLSLLRITGGAALGVVTVKVTMAILGWALDWSWLPNSSMFRSGSDNCPNLLACLLAAGGAGGGSGGKGQPRGGKPPDPAGQSTTKGPPDSTAGKGPTDPSSGKGGGNPSPGNYTPTPGSNPVNDPALQDAQSKYLAHNPQPDPSQPGSGGININHWVQNAIWNSKK
jgi:hypothetical protein